MLKGRRTDIDRQLTSKTLRSPRVEPELFSQTVSIVAQRPAMRLEGQLYQSQIMSRSDFEEIIQINGFESNP